MGRVVVFLDRGHPCFWNFNSTIPVDVVSVKYYVTRLFDPACVPMRITIRRGAKKRTTERTTHRNSEDRNATITAVENQPITAEHSGL